jgi:hypothetical protein
MKMPLYPISISSSDEAREIVAPYANRLVRCIQTGPQKWATVLGASPAEMREMDKRTVASMLYTWVTNEIEREFANDSPNVVTVRQYTSLRLNIKDLIIGKFNKCDCEGYTRRNRTAASNAFYGQRKYAEQLSFLDGQIRQLGLPGVNQPTLVTVGWHLDPTETKIENILVGCPLGKDLLWKFSILSPTEVEVVAVPQLFAATETPSKARVVPKPEKIKDAGQQSEQQSS